MTDHRDDPHSRAADAVHEGRPVEAQYVRQGRKGMRIVLVLAVSLGLAVLAVFGFWALQSDDLATTRPQGGESEASAFTTTDEPAIKQNPDADSPSPNDEAVSPPG